MSLNPGSRLGPYEVVSRLGAGAMGEVYRARDSRLGRDVAIKILPADVAADPSRRGRFEQEARAVAALNHPNILGLYDIGNEDGVAYIVTEFVAGETLAALLERGPLPNRKVLEIATQIAAGMAAAHAAHITHRDLKPLNIMVGADGRVRILDFGLAKQAVRSADPDETVLAGHTQPGMILGTVSYMSPEQARGAEADYRSDQFSFGVILYEMVTGKRAFDRPETVQTMSAIIGEEPPPIDKDIPAPLRWTIERCLAKAPADRFESTRDMYLGLQSLRDHGGGSGVSQAPAVVPAPVAKRTHFSWAVPAAFVLGLLTALAIHWLRAGPPMPDQSTYRFTPFSFAPGGQNDALWSPDGKAVAYSARQAEGPNQTYIRYLDSATPVQLTHTAENASPIAWAPDGRRLLLDIDREPAAIWRIATVGGEPEIAVPNVRRARGIGISPDNRSIAFIYAGDEGRYGVWVSSPPTAAAKRYLPDPYGTKDLYNRPDLKFSPDGKQMLLLLNAGRQSEEAWLLPYPADPSHPPKRVLQDLQSASGTPEFAWMPDSRHVVLSLQRPGETSEQLWMADTVSGERYALTSGTASRSAPAISPDGESIVFREGSGTFDIVSVDLANAAVHPLIETARNEQMPSWAAQKALLAYVTDRNGGQEIWLRDAAAGSDRPLVSARDFPGVRLQWLMGPALSPEGDRVVYTRIDLGTATNRLWISAVAGGPPVALTSDTGGSEYPGSWSPDGSWFAFVWFRNGKPALCKVKTSGEAASVTVKENVAYLNAAVPVWSPDGQWIELGEMLYSADGQQSRPLGDHHADAYVFAPDGKQLYGIRENESGAELFTVDSATGAEKAIGSLAAQYRPRSNLSPAMRLSLSPDGKTIAYGVGDFRDNLWLLEGFAAKVGWWQRLGL